MSCFRFCEHSSQQPGEHVCFIAVAAFSLRVTHAFFLFGMSGAVGEIT